jgi:hypothetical protein
MNVSKGLWKFIELFFFVVNSFVYRLLWPSETDRQVISGIIFLNFAILECIIEFIDLSSLPDKANLVERIKQQSMFVSSL